MPAWRAGEGRGRPASFVDASREGLGLSPVFWSGFPEPTHTRLAAAVRRCATILTHPQPSPGGSVVLPPRFRPPTGRGGLSLSPYGEAWGAPAWALMFAGFNGVPIAALLPGTSILVLCLEIVAQGVCAVPEGDPKTTTGT